MKRISGARKHGRVVALAGLLTAVMMATACSAPGAGRDTGKGLGFVPATGVPHDSARAVSRQALIHPAHKYVGISVDGAPESLQPVEEIAAKTHRTPNLVTYFADWTHPFDTAAARAACAAGIVPALTWESWSWEDTSKGAPAATQPSYAPRTIAAGAYDGYIRRTAAAIKSLGCPIMLRLDQESNGAWYPWAVGTPGMDNTAAQYVAMWRHVWRIFHTVGADNVIWLWSPNIRWQPGVRNLAELYPGNKYVDIVGIDGYLISPGDTPGIVFDSTMRELRSVAPNKPWLIAETGVAAGPNQPAQITALLAAVAANPRLIGLVYLDEPEALGNWSFTGAPASVVAFRRGIDSPTYGQARADTS